MILNVFNPDHDMALANGSPGYTAPRIIQRMAVDLAWLPRLWADEGVCLADDVDFSSISEVRPWGWDAAIRQRLLRMGVDPNIMPTDEYLATVRRLSSRALAIDALQQFRSQGCEWLCGESCWIESIDQLPSWPQMVVKAPWSSSGKGIVFINGTPTEAQVKWCRNTLAAQGGLAVERLCDVAHDFAMEYTVEHGEVRYVGLSLFTNSSTGAYTGNVLASAEYKLGILGLEATRLHEIAAMHIDFIAQRIAPHYNGPIGIDMLVTRDGHVNPCIEINLRRTMGHVALALEAKTGTAPLRRFTVGYDKETGYYARTEELAHNAE